MTDLIKFDIFFVYFMSFWICWLLFYTLFHFRFVCFQFGLFYLSLFSSPLCVYCIWICICVSLYIFLSPLSNPFCVLCQKPWVGALSRALDSCSLVKLDFHIYKENLLPLNWEYNFHNCITFCSNPFTDLDILTQLWGLTKKSQ